MQVNTLRLKYINECVKADIVPRFLKFRVPDNGCFDDNTVHEFQIKLLRKELVRARNDRTSAETKLDERRKLLKNAVPDNLLVSVAFHSRIHIRVERRTIQARHNKKLLELSEEQEKPLFNVRNTVLTYELDTEPPKYVMETLSLGPKNAVLDTFKPNDILAELDGLLYYCKTNDVDRGIVSDINIKTLQYVKKCKKQKPSRNITMTKKYLKDNDLLAIPFDKGVGICVMKREKYEEKMSDILNLPQFEKVVQTRKNAKHPVSKEHERVCKKLLDLQKNGKIDAELYTKLYPTGSQPARTYGLAKVHKTTVPTRPVLSMPGSAYHNTALQCTAWLSVVEECRINSSTKSISDSLQSIELDDDEELISFDVTSLYTNVPVKEAIAECADLLYSGKYELPPVDKATFIDLLSLCTCNVLMSTHDGFYRQVDGLAMGSPPAPLLANGWLHKYDATIRDDAKLYARYMDDVIRSIKSRDIVNKLLEINSLHEKLKFTFEREQERLLAFLDMLLKRENNKLSSTWYQKPTDTGLVMNYHALAPKRYKRSVVAGFVYRIYRACSSWKLFHASLERAKQILEKNQYPPQFYNPIIKQALLKIIKPDGEEVLENAASDEGKEAIPRKMIFLQYRGKVTEDFCRELRKCNAPVMPVLTLRKLKTVLPSLKSCVDHRVRSHVVYKITCPRCASRYVGWTSQHTIDRFQQHMKPSQPVGKHVRECGVHKQMNVDEHMEIVEACSRSILFLQTLEAIHQELLRPEINKKEEWRSRELTIKL